MRAVIAESYERIHRSNLVGMGMLPLQFKAGENADVAGPERRRSLRFRGLARHCCKRSAQARLITVKAKKADGSVKTFQAVVRIDTPQEVHYYHHGGILQYVLRQLGQK